MVLKALAHIGVLASLAIGCSSAWSPWGLWGPRSDRRLNAQDIRLPTGYGAEVVASGLTYPTGVAFDGSGSFDPDPGDTISYSWDLNGDGTYGDSTAQKPTFTIDSSAPAARAAAQSVMVQRIAGTDFVMAHP